MIRSFVEGLNNGRNASDIGWRNSQAGRLFVEKVDQQERQKGAPLDQRAASLVGFVFGLLERDLVHAAIRTIAER